MAKKKSQKKSGAKRPRTVNAAGLGCRILDCIRSEIEGAELTPSEHYNKQVLARGGVYAKGNYTKGDALAEEQPPAGHIRLCLDLKVGKPRAKRRTTGK
jgi:hypothetical protein